MPSIGEFNTAELFSGSAIIVMTEVYTLKKWSWKKYEQHQHGIAQIIFPFEENISQKKVQLKCTSN